MWFDTHCHLYNFEQDAPAVAERARACGVTGICVVGVDEASSRLALDLTDLPGVHAGAAIHPTETKGWDDAWADPIDELLNDERVVAVGETGIDLYWDKTFLDDQRRALKRHVELSKKHDKALVMHTRDSIVETLDLLDEVGPSDRMIFHCWSGDEPSLTRALEMGACISFAGNVTYKKSDDLRAAALRVPNDRLLVETDAPYLSPEPVRRDRNEPSNVIHTGALIAQVRGMEIEELAQVTTDNALTVFGLR